MASVGRRLRDTRPSYALLPFQPFAPCLNAFSPLRAKEYTARGSSSLIKRAGLQTLSILRRRAASPPPPPPQKKKKKKKEDSISPSLSLFLSLTFASVDKFNRYHSAGSQLNQPAAIAERAIRRFFSTRANRRLFNLRGAAFNLYVYTPVSLVNERGAHSVFVFT